MSIQVNIVTCPTYPEKFLSDSVIAPFLLPPVVIVTPLIIMQLAIANKAAEEILGDYFFATPCVCVCVCECNVVSMLYVGRCVYNCSDHVPSIDCVCARTVRVATERSSLSVFLPFAIFYLSILPVSVRCA